MAKLIYHCNNKPKQEIEIPDEREVYIGRAQHSTATTITLNDECISRCHAKLEKRVLPEGGACHVLTDEGSTNGTYLFNGEFFRKLQPQEEITLVEGDRIKFSKHEFEYHDGV